MPSGLVLLPSAIDCHAAPATLGSPKKLTRGGHTRMLTTIFRCRRSAIALIGALLSLLTMPAQAADPIRIGLSISLPGPTAAAGKQVLAGLDIWRDDINAKGGLLGRPVEFVYYDDQGNPANAPSLYAKL